MCSGDGDVPLYLKVADAALYSVDNIESLANLKWVSRVPATIKDAEQLMAKVSEEAFISSTLEGYKIACICNTYGGIRQRWLVVESQARLKSDLKQQLHQIEVKQIPYDNKAGRPTKGQEPDGCHYRLIATLIPKQATRRAGRFVLATNILESEILSWDEILIKYKEQQSTERGFLLRKPTSTPTMRWVFQCFQSIHLVIFNGLLYSSP